MNKKFLLATVFIFLGMFFCFAQESKAQSIDVICGQCYANKCQPENACKICSTCPGYIPPIQHEGKPLGTFKGLGALSDFIDSLQKNPSKPDPASNAFSNFISKAIGIMTVIAIIWFIFTLFLGAIAWISSGGDKTKLQNAQKQITTGLMGLIIVIAALFLVKIIGIIFGIDILNITNLINNL